MHNSLFLPRYGSLEHKRLGMMGLMTLIIAFFCLIPDLAMAFTGDFTPNDKVVTAVDGSFKKWWKTIAIPAFWLSLAGLVISVIFMGGRGWYIPLSTAALFLFGEMLITGVQKMMG